VNEEINGVGVMPITGPPAPEEATMNPIRLERADGYRGIWYMNQPTKDAFKYKYSGGFATYPQQHIPIAVHVPAAQKTFFVYGGTVPGRQELLHMVSYFDHRTKTVPRPAILLNKKTEDAHDNPVLSIDDAGHLWIFSNAHGTGRPSYLHRSVEPYSIDAFEKVWETNFSYGQPWHVPGKGFLFLHTRYAAGRGLHAMSSADGRTWTNPKMVAFIVEGDYQISWPNPRRGMVGTAFDYHPNLRAKGINQAGLNARTNIYYVETADMGRTWQTADGRVVETPLKSVKNPALVHDYEAEGLLVYLKDLQYDASGHPIILYLTSKGFEPGPQNGPRTWKTARWTGSGWVRRPVLTSDHNYDHGSLYMDSDTDWRIIAPTLPGPQPDSTGGEITVWRTRNSGLSWQQETVLTRSSPRNHTYVRRPLNPHPDFAGFWADGNPLEESESRLYFTDRAASAVWQLPTRMTGDAAAPERLSLP
jgi:hypothetical protein